MALLENPASSVIDGRKEVAVAGTEEKLSTDDSRIISVAITAETNNTGIIVVGGSTVIASESTRRGTPLAAGDTTVLTVSQLSAVWLDTTVNTDGVTYLALRP
mgnify:CR=1 FL=1